MEGDRDQWWLCCCKGSLCIPFWVTRIVLVGGPSDCTGLLAHRPHGTEPCPRAEEKTAELVVAHHIVRPRLASNIHTTEHRMHGQPRWHAHALTYASHSTAIELRTERATCDLQDWHAVLSVVWRPPSAAATAEDCCPAESLCAARYDRSFTSASRTRHGRLSADRSADR